MVKTVFKKLFSENHSHRQQKSSVSCTLPLNLGDI